MVFYFKVENQIDTGTKMMIEFPTGFDISSATCSFDIYVQIEEGFNSIDCTPNAQVMEITQYKSIARNTNFRIIVTNIGTPAAPVVTENFKVSVEVEKS